MKKYCLFFYKKYKCVCFKVHYTGLTLSNEIVFSVCLNIYANTFGNILFHCSYRHLCNYKIQNKYTCTCT